MNLKLKTLMSLSFHVRRISTLFAKTHVSFIGY